MTFVLLKGDYNMIIRKVNQNDSLGEITSIYEESWKYAYKGIIPQDYLDGLSGKQWTFAADNPDRASLIMLDGEKIIGTASFGKSRLSDMPGWGEIISIYFLPEYMGKGYGNQLLQAAVSGLADCGYKDIFLWVLEENLRAIRFYEKNGFRFSGRYLDDNIGGKPLREKQYILTQTGA